MLTIRPTFTLNNKQLKLCILLLKKQETYSTLFSKTVNANLLYGCEIWGYWKYRCSRKNKHILNIKRREC